MQSAFFHDLQQRGLVFQHTPKLKKSLQEKSISLYLGFDPTGPNMHIGHLCGIITLKRFLEAGHNIIILVGGGTSMIGDPGGKDKERPILSKEEIEQNKTHMKKQFRSFFEFDNIRVRMVDNADWLERVSLIDFLRNAGKHISISSMLDKESVSTRLKRDSGISYAEFSYQLMQAYDYVRLFQEYNCTLQIGGSDQWGNIIQGVELIRKTKEQIAHALSFPLITNPKTGKKFGKTESGEAIWLEKEKTHPFQFFQFFLNTEDDIAPNLMNYYSMRPLSEIQEIITSWEQEKHTRSLQREIARELTTMLHGQQMTTQVEKISSILFEKGNESLTEEDFHILRESIPYHQVLSSTFTIEDTVVDLGLVSSKGEARRLVKQNGIHAEEYFDRFILLRKGKRDYGLVEKTS